MYGSPPFIKFSEKYKWNVRTVRGTMGSGKFEFVELTKYLKKLLTPTLRNSLEYTYREEGKANDDSK